jgi:hypothetical protein
MFNSLLGLAAGVTKIVIAPVAIAVDVARIATKPIAEVAGELAKEVKKATQD